MTHPAAKWTSSKLALPVWGVPSKWAFFIDDTSGAIPCENARGKMYGRDKHRRSLDCHEKTSFSHLAHTATTIIRSNRRKCAEQAARNFSVELHILYANNDAITQSTQILKAIQSAENLRPMHCLRARRRHALPSGPRRCFYWNRLGRSQSRSQLHSELRKLSSAPVFVVTSDHIEIGRIQAASLLPCFPKAAAFSTFKDPPRILRPRNVPSACRKPNPPYPGNALERAVDRRELPAFCPFLAQAQHLPKKQPSTSWAPRMIPWPWERAKPSRSSTSRNRNAGSSCRLLVARLA